MSTYLPAGNLRVPNIQYTQKSRFVVYAVEYKNFTEKEENESEDNYIANIFCRVEE